MFIIDAIANAVSAVAGLAAAPIKGWQDRATLRAEAKARLIEAETNAKIARLERADKAEADWDTAALSQMRDTWKDEFYVLLFSVPLVMCFIPPLVPYVKDGFSALDGMPDWYKWAIGLMVASTFGYRRFADGVGRLVGAVRS